MTFAILIDFLAHHFGTPLEDAGGASVLEVGGVQVILQEAGDLLLLRTEIGDLPEDDRAPLLAAILEANHLYRGTGGATLALVPGTSRLCLQKYTWLDRLAPDTIPDLLFRFSSTAATWHRLLADYRPAAPGDAPPPSPTSSKSDPTRLRAGRGGKQEKPTQRRGGLGGGKILHERTKRQQKGRMECGRDVCIENHENRFADIETWEEHEWDAGRERKRVPSGGGSAMMRASGRPRLPDHPEELTDDIQGDHRRARRSRKRGGRR